MKTVSDIINWLMGGSATAIAVIIGIIVVKTWPIVHTILDSKATTAKSSKTKQYYEQLDQWAAIAVAAVSVNLDAMGSDKKKEAVRIVNRQLADHKIDIDVENVANAIESAYQSFKLTQPASDTKVAAPAKTINTAAVKE